MREQLKVGVNRILGRLGLRLTKIETLERLVEQRRWYLTLVGQAEKHLLGTMFSNIPPDPRRPELLADATGIGVFAGLLLVDCLHQSLSLEGDICEFGVAAGRTSALLAHELLESGKTFWLFDSFKGLPKPTQKDVLIHDIFAFGSMERYEGQMAYSIREVKMRLGAVGFPVERTKIVPGFVEEVISTEKELPLRVCFAFVDFDFHKPIATTLDFLHLRLSKGAFVIVHDYGFFSAGAKTAVDEFMQIHSQEYDFDLPSITNGFIAVLRKRC